MARRGGRKASTRVREDEPFSTKEVIASMRKALAQLRDERTKRGRKWKFPQHIQAAKAEWALVLAIDKCRCGKVSHSFPSHGLTEKAALK